MSLLNEDYMFAFPGRNAVIMHDIHTEISDDETVLERSQDEGVASNGNEIYIQCFLCVRVARKNHRRAKQKIAELYQSKREEQWDRERSKREMENLYGAEEFVLDIWPA